MAFLQNVCHGFTLLLRAKVDHPPLQHLFFPFSVLLLFLVF